MLLVNQSIDICGAKKCKNFHIKKIIALTIRPSSFKGLRLYKTPYHNQHFNSIFKKGIFRRSIYFSLKDRTNYQAKPLNLKDKNLLLTSLSAEKVRLYVKE